LFLIIRSVDYITYIRDAVTDYIQADPQTVVPKNYNSAGSGGILYAMQLSSE